MIIINGKECRNLQEQVLWLTKILQSMEAYTAGTGITIAGNTIAIDTATVQEKLTAGDNITITGNVIAADVPGAKKLTGLAFPSESGGTIKIIYDSDSGAEISSVGDASYADGSTETVNVEYDIPIIPGDNVTIDTSDEGDALVISSSGVGVVLSSPTSAVSGTLTEAEAAKLAESPNNWINFNNERYILMDNGHTVGISVYVHVGYSTALTAKYISLTASTRAWTLTTAELVSKSEADAQIAAVREDLTTVQSDIADLQADLLNVSRFSLDSEGAGS